MTLLFAPAEKVKTVGTLSRAKLHPLCFLLPRALLFQSLNHSPSTSKLVIDGHHVLHLPVKTSFHLVSGS
jgi:hypothetical protein